MTPIDTSEMAAKKTTAKKANTPKKAAKPVAPPPPAAPSASKGKRLSYMEQRDWDAIPGLIEAAEKKAAVIEAKMAEPAVMNDRKKMADACAEFEKIQQEVTKLYARWEELETKQG